MILIFNLTLLEKKCCPAKDSMVILCGFKMICVILVKMDFYGDAWFYVILSHVLVHAVGQTGPCRGTPYPPPRRASISQAAASDLCETNECI